MHLFFTPNIDTDIFVLDEIESKHCTRVLRLKTNDTIQLTDGKGNMCTAKLINEDPKHCNIKIIETIHNFEKRDFYLHIAIAPTKNIDRFEWFLEKATEIGIDEITPIITDFSERAFIKAERFNKILISAMKQSVKAYLPKLNELQKLDELIKNNNTKQKYIAHCYESPKKQIAEVYSKNKESLILIGPEGDFSQTEVNLAITHQFQEISLGNSRLRTETAGVVACHTINLLNNL